MKLFIKNIEISMFCDIITIIKEFKVGIFMFKKKKNNFNIMNIGENLIKNTHLF